VESGDNARSVRSDSDNNVSSSPNIPHQLESASRDFKDLQLTLPSMWRPYTPSAPPRPSLFLLVYKSKRLIVARPTSYDVR
jgi:hypothetical protein